MRKSKMAGRTRPAQDHRDGPARALLGSPAVGTLLAGKSGGERRALSRSQALPSTLDMSWATWGGAPPPGGAALPSLHSMSVEMDASSVLDVADAGDTPRVICLVLI